MDEAIFQAAKRLYDFMSDCPPAPEKADVILALGSHDLRVPDHAASLYLSGIAPLIVCTGGYGKMTEGAFPKPEGVLFAERCVARGVPAEAILVEDRAANTGENFSLSRKLVRGMQTKQGSLSASPIWRSALGLPARGSGPRPSGASAFQIFPFCSTRRTKRR